MIGASASRPIFPLFSRKEEISNKMWCESCIVCVARPTPTCGHPYQTVESRFAKTQDVGNTTCSIFRTPAPCISRSYAIPWETPVQKRKMLCCKSRKTVARRIATVACSGTRLRRSEAPAPRGQAGTISGASCEAPGHERSGQRLGAAARGGVRRQGALDADDGIEIARRDGVHVGEYQILREIASELRFILAPHDREGVEDVRRVVTLDPIEMEEQRV